MRGRLGLVRRCTAPSSKRCARSQSMSRWLGSHFPMMLRWLCTVSFGFTDVGIFDEYATKNGGYISSVWMQLRLPPSG